MKNEFSVWRFQERGKNDERHQTGIVMIPQQSLNRRSHQRSRDMSTTDVNELQSEAPGLKLSARGLTILFIVMLSLPVIAITILVQTLPKVADLPLDAEIILVTKPANDARFTITNQSDELWKSVRMTINKAFYYLPTDEVPAGEQLTVPLEWFGHKGGHRFDIEKGDVRQFQISIRLPNNRRALKELDYSEQPPGEE